MLPDQVSLLLTVATLSIYALDFIPSCLLRNPSLGQYSHVLLVHILKKTSLTLHPPAYVNFPKSFKYIVPPFHHLYTCPFIPLFFILPSHNETTHQGHSWSPNCQIQWKHVCTHLNLQLQSNQQFIFLPKALSRLFWDTIFTFVALFWFHFLFWSILSHLYWLFFS